MNEDDNGHLVDETGALVDDPRCYWCVTGTAEGWAQAPEGPAPG